MEAGMEWRRHKKQQTTHVHGRSLQLKDEVSMRVFKWLAKTEMLQNLIYDIRI